MEPVSRDEIEKLIKEAEAEAGEKTSVFQQRIAHLKEEATKFAEQVEEPKGGMDIKEEPRGKRILLSTGPINWHDFEE